MALTQTLHLLLINGIHIDGSSINLQLGDNTKQCRPNLNIQSVTFKAYVKDARLCVCETLRTYITCTEKLRPGVSKAKNKLIISFVKSHKPVFKDTIAKYIQIMLCRAGVDTSTYLTAGEDFGGTNRMYLDKRWLD